jgi:hypothetical protein
MPKPKPKPSELPRGCPRCHEKPFVDSAQGLVRCHCARGRELYNRDLERAGQPRLAEGQPRPTRRPAPDDTGGLFT